MRDTLTELATTATDHGHEDVNTRLAPALVQAAKNFAKQRLANAVEQQGADLVTNRQSTDVQPRPPRHDLVDT
ncbi:hypothetical protein [Streptomyces sp. 35G-GA-8]|uniref:hypothetical protein n=1 Tax=Streptomyces sp. 35G-GA-8 TaxID=2939434 RepID=UPI00201EB613|nr:hypothetical protein [Streptomyces sp. 35G-GA-8]MCL7379832.1 hypothetical protein [Streptomyces sp. 35G-GA-8]